MERTTGWTLGELAVALGGTLDGPADLRILRPVPAGEDDPQGLTFAGTGAYLAAAIESGVGAVIVPHEAPSGMKPLIRHANPRGAFGRFLGMVGRPVALAEGIDPRAAVDGSATVDPTARIGPFAVVEAGATVAKGARVYPFAYVGEGCTVGENATILPHAVLLQDVSIGRGTTVHSGAVLGTDGFGFVWDGARRQKVPQVGRVEIGEDVEIGANATVDRATAGATRVGDGTKLDNLVMVGHNVTIGRHSVLASQTGISGSSSIGDRCVLGGQVGVKDHASVTDDVTLSARAGVTKNLTEPGVYRGFPAETYTEDIRREAAMRRVPKLMDRIKELERRLAALEAGS